MSKPIFDQPYGLKYQVDSIRMELSWRPDFGAEKTAALQRPSSPLRRKPRGSSTATSPSTPAS